MVELVNGILFNFFRQIVAYAPNFFGGLIILFIGIVLASLLKRVLLSLLSFFKLGLILEKSKLIGRGEVRIWEEVFAEILKWTIVILFLLPTLEVWQLSRATIVLNQFLFYLPNVIAAVIIAFVGLLTSNLVSDLVLHSFTTLGAGWAKTLSMLSKATIMFFTILIVMNQLGVAQDLVRILFTGIVAMIALAGGLAFGLGGREMAAEILSELKKKLK